MNKLQEIRVLRGETYEADVFWETEPIVYKAITAIDLSFGAPRLTATGHGAKSGWSGAVTRVLGMRQINAESSPPAGRDYHRMTAVDANTIELNDVDASGFSPYESGGFLQYNTHQDLTGYTARMDVRTKEGGDLIISSQASAAPLDIINLTVDTVNRKIRVGIDAADTAAIPLTAKTGVATLEMVGPTGVVKRLKLTRGKDDEPDRVVFGTEVTT